MAQHGTGAYTGADGLPPLVRHALAAARAHGFPFSCRPEQGRLLHTLAGGARLRIGETGTGLGVGLAWLASGAAPGVRLVSVEREPERARRAAEVFTGRSEVTVLTGDWRRIAEYGPFDLLVLDGAGRARRPGTRPPTWSGCWCPAGRSSWTTSRPRPDGRRCTRAGSTGPGCTGWSIPRCGRSSCGSRPI